MKKIITKVAAIALVLIVLAGCGANSSGWLRDEVVNYLHSTDFVITQQVGTQEGGTYVLVKYAKEGQEWLDQLTTYKKFPRRREIGTSSSGILVDPRISPGLTLGTGFPGWTETDGKIEDNWTLLGYSNSVDNGTVEMLLNDGTTVTGKVVSGTFILPFNVSRTEGSLSEPEIQELRILVNGQVVETWPNATFQ